MKKSELIAELRADERCFELTRDSEPASSGFPLEGMSMYRANFLMRNGDGSLTPRYAEYVVKDEGKAGEEAAWLGGPALGADGGLAARVQSAPEVRAMNGRIVQVRETCVIVSGLADVDSDGKLEEVLYSVTEKDGNITMKELKATTLASAERPVGV